MLQKYHELKLKKKTKKHQRCNLFQILYFCKLKPKLYLISLKKNKKNVIIFAKAEKCPCFNDVLTNNISHFVHRIAIKLFFYDFGVYFNF